MNKSYLCVIVFIMVVMNSFSQTNIFPSSGYTGIGTTTPNSLLTIVSLLGQSESFARFEVHDASEDYFQISNATGSASQLIPVVRGHHVSDNRFSLQISGSTSGSNDSGDNALVNFDARLPSGPVQYRPLFVWTNYTTKLMTMSSDGNVGIGTTNPGTWKLAVNGNIRAKEIKVETGWADFVFDADYDLPTLPEVEAHIKDKGHLQGIPSAQEVKENGILLGEMDSKLLQKIEELMLYTIQQQKEIDQLKQELAKIQTP